MAQTQGSGKSERGFAAMDEQKQRDIASRGGKAAHQRGAAHEFDSREAREAGRKGGEAISRDRQHMAEIGRKGGEARGANGGQSRGGSHEPRGQSGQQGHKSK
ncbi:MAG TPA: KGG domain-containing protein [Chthonomonadales bacterium]|nr:KGG domain-containing protein [Chthonomonadales bacterium]